MTVFNAYSLLKKQAVIPIERHSPKPKGFLVNMKRLHPKICIIFTFLRDFLYVFTLPLFRCGISDRQGMYHHENSLAHFEKSSLNYL